MPGFCKSASLDEIRSHGDVLTPGRYVGAEAAEEDETPFAERFAALQEQLEAQFAEAEDLTATIRARLGGGWLVSVEEIFGELPSGWAYQTLGEVCAQGAGGVQTGPFGSQLHAADYVPVGIPSIMPQNIGDNRISEVGIARITPEDAERLSKYCVRPGDIVYSRRGDVERSALVRESEDGWLCETGCLRVRLGDGPVDPVFAAFYLGTAEAREWIVRHVHGATMPNLNTSILAACPIIVPPPRTTRHCRHPRGAG